MAELQAHVGDTGTDIILTVQDQDGVVVNMSTATLTDKLTMLKPDGTRVTKTVVLNTTGLDGKVKYTTIAADLSMAGWYQFQFEDYQDATHYWKSDIIKRLVLANL